MVMFCKQCGSPVPEGTAFCRNCGAAAAAAAVQAQPAVRPAQRQGRQPAGWLMDRVEYVSTNIIFCADGKYRWVYELRLFRNPTVFLMIWKIFFFLFLGIFAVTMLGDVIRWGVGALAENLRFLLYFFLGMTAVVGLGYAVYAAIMGGTYTVLFEMDEHGVNHRQVAPQAKKAKELGALAALAGAARGNFTTVGVGLNAQRTEMYSDFSGTRRVKACPRRHLIKVNGLLSHNQVYAEPEDFAFVKDYILAHCPNLK